jgi:adenylyltransferase/sulfurtransferase
MNFEALSRGFASDSHCQFNEFLMKCVTPPYELTLFKDGRAIIKGTEDPALARSVYAKLVGT